MDIFQELQKLVNERLRKDEDRKIEYLLTGKIPDEFKCPNCRERLNPENHIVGINNMICDSLNNANK
jgi:hypothetical protein